MKHFVVYKKYGDEAPVDCYATVQAAQGGLRGLGDLAAMEGSIAKIRDGSLCPACGMVVDEGLEAEVIR